MLRHKRQHECLKPSFTYKRSVYIIVYYKTLAWSTFVFNVLELHNYNTYFYFNFQHPFQQEIVLSLIL